MKKLLILACAGAATVLTSAPAVAQAVNPSSQADARATILRPLSIVADRDLDLGTIVLSGTGAYTQQVGITRAGVFSCGGASLTCSGNTQTAQYTVTGTNMQTVTVNVSNSITLNNQTDNLSSLAMAVDAPATVSLGTSGNSGVQFDIGGSIQVSNTTPDGVYVGQFDVSVEYQ
jgi:hypothetical protein